jgi:hypothetical protein
MLQTENEKHSHMNAFALKTTTPNTLWLATFHAPVFFTLKQNEREANCGDNDTMDGQVPYYS